MSDRGRRTRVADLVEEILAHGITARLIVHAQRFKIDVRLLQLVARAFERGTASLGDHDPAEVELYAAAASRWVPGVFTMTQDLLVVGAALAPLAAELAAILETEREVRLRLHAVRTRKRALAARLVARGDHPKLLELAVRLARRAGHGDAVAVYGRMAAALDRFTAAAQADGATVDEARGLAAGRLAAVVEQHVGAVG